MSNQDKKILELKSLVEGAELSLQQARKILDNLSGEEGASLAGEAKRVGSQTASAEGQIIEGLFDGQNMLGPDGKRYSVPANYASKSKLVEGDGLKLTIMPDGSFVYKQINLLERDRLVGVLTIDEKTDEYRVVAEGKSFKVLTASITYYKGESGDRVTILVPKGRETTWAAVENVFKAGDEIPGVSDGLKAEKSVAAETAKSIFDEVKLPESTAPVPELPEVQKNTGGADENSFLREERSSDDLYGPSIPAPQAGGGTDSFLRPEPTPNDGLGDRDNQGLEEI